MKENSLMLKEVESRQDPMETITDADHVDDRVLLANTPAQAESQLHNLELAVRGIGLYVNVNKTEFICFKQGAITLKLID